MYNVHPTESLENKNPHNIAARWRNIWYRVKWKISSIVASENGKKSLRDGTKERIHKEVLLDLERIAQEKKMIQEESPSLLRGVLRWVSRQEKLWKNNWKSDGEAYNTQAITHLLAVPNSESEVLFVREFLLQIVKIKKDVLDNILLNPKYREE